MSEHPRPRRDGTPWLTVRGNAVVAGRRSGPASPEHLLHPIVLRGFNLSGLQHREFQWADSLRWRDAAGLAAPVLRKICEEWDINIVRLPVNRDWFLEGLARAGRDWRESRQRYRSDIREIAGELSRHGVYTLLNPHSQAWSADDPRPYTPPMPDGKMLEFWEAAASEFRNEPAVLFDLFNEPHPPLPPPAEPPCEGPVPRDPAGWVTAWHDWVRSMESVIHGAHPEALLFVSGIGGPCWSASLRGMPVPMPPFEAGPTRQQCLPNAVYAAHVYRHGAPGRPDQATGGRHVPGTMTRRDFDHWFGFTDLRKRHPVFVTEWGACLDRRCTHQACAGRTGKWGTAARRRWLRKLESYMRSLHTCDRDGAWQGLAGWTAWSWGDHPHLALRNEQGEYRLTDFGGMVKEALARPA